MAESTHRVAYEPLLDTEMQAITSVIREQALKLLRDKQVSVVVGYTSVRDSNVATPVFITDVFHVTQLVFNANCTHNLAKYLVGYEGLLTSHLKPREQRPKVAIVARPATMRAIVGLMQERQLNRGDLVVLGITDGSAVGIEPDVVVGEVPSEPEKRQAIEAKSRELESLSVAQRWAWWQKEFSKCVRCYACRQVCPFCYCEQCIADQNQPQWIEKSPSPWNNRAWNIVRALHLTGRCVECGECERVCPVNIPLSLLNGKMALRAEEAFDYVAGLDPQTPSVLYRFDRDDPGAFIR